MKTQNTIRNCSVFSVRCPKLWEHLETTDQDDVRHCNECHQEAFYCRTDQETIQHALAGHCIARELPDASELPACVLGKPTRPLKETAKQSQARQWAARERGIDDSIKNAKASTRACPVCNFRPATGEKLAGFAGTIWDAFCN